jgi:ATP-binding cassette, subfamily B, bacterial
MKQSESNFGTLWKLMEGQRGRYLCALVAMFLGVGLIYLTPLITRGAIDGIIDARHAAVGAVSSSDGGAVPWAARFFARQQAQFGAGWALVAAGAALVVVTALSALFMSVQGRLSGVASEKITRRLRNRLYRHLQQVPMAWHDKIQTGDIVQRCTSDVDTVRLFYLQQVIEIARSSLRILIGIPILLLIDWKMALVATGLMPVIVGFAIIFFRRVQGSFKKTDEAEGFMTAALQENLTGIRVVRAFARQEFEIERFTKKSTAYRDRHWHLFRIMALYWSTSDLMCIGQFAAIVFVGAYRASIGTMTIGTMIAFVSYAQMFIWPIREVGRTLTELGKTLVSIERIKELLVVAEETAPVHPIRGAARAKGELELSHVSFHFGENAGDKWVLRDVSLSIPAGTTLGLLGPSGSGKTTLVNLLMRMYDPQQGLITLDGIDLKSLDRKYVRGQCGAVLQEPFLFSKTLRENIKMGRHIAADEEMILAARAAAIHESIEGFDRKYDTLLGERGVTLSGGQRQRTAIARALLKDAPVLILDDALSAVDTQTEVSILDQLKKRRGRQTVIIIAHRLSTIMHADQIAIVEHGRIVERGTHEELIGRAGLYRDLWRIQGAMREEVDPPQRGDLRDVGVAAFGGEGRRTREPAEPDTLGGETGTEGEEAYEELKE